MSREIRKHYNYRDRVGGETDFWSIFNPVVQHVAQERERVLFSLLKEHVNMFANAKVLDVGCGAGGELINYLRAGCQKENLFGVDLSISRLMQARKIFGFNMTLADGSLLPYPEGCFNIVVQNVVFSSITNSLDKKKLALEMSRILANDGLLIWYDARICRRQTKNYRSIPKKEVEALFPDMNFVWKTLTTDIGVLRLVNMLGGNIAMDAVDMSRIFRTHLLGVGRNSDI